MWVRIETPSGCEPCQVSVRTKKNNKNTKILLITVFLSKVSPTGNVWILCWSGQILARSGIRWDCETGITWLEISAPFPGVSFSHISLGSQSAWAVSRENQVFRRRGLDTSAIGLSWMEMVGSMNLVFTGADNQVCGLLIQDQKIYLRTNVSKDDLGGRCWKMIPSGDLTFTWLSFDDKGFVLRLEDTADSSWSEPWRYFLLYFASTPSIKN